jgi:hypothetical protein
MLAVSFIGFVLFGGLAWWISGDGDVALLGGLMVPVIVESWQRRRARSGPPPEGAIVNRDGVPIIFGSGDWGGGGEDGDDGGGFGDGGFGGD